ncbi:hypothetical protein [Acidithiobacillus ferridurans]|uniref:hypothetical protein n=1 Tax=Acidithiobacillus ferridurans TaxID=1232575 RepID=UPI001D01DBEE|nr:hypothetical protein [Acidithiobacillus ferridurans]
MRNKPSHSLWKRQMLTFASVVVFGTAAATPFAYAAPYEGTLAPQRPHATIVHLWINGHSVPAAAQSRVIHFPGGVMQVQTVTWGPGGSSRHVQISSENLPPAQAQAMVQHSLWQMQAMQVSMDRQIARMQRLMRVSFGPFAMPSFRLPIPVALLSSPPEMPFSGGIPRGSLNLGGGANAAPSVPRTSLPGHQTLQVRWDRPKTSSPKIPL